MDSRCKFYKECKSTPVTLIPHSKMPLCKRHFIKYIEDRVKKAIEEYNLIDMEGAEGGEKILVALSGGKDSQTLLTILDQIIKRRVPIEALYIEVGITPENYSRDSEVVARKLCDKLGIPFHVIDVKQEIGFDIDDLHALGARLSRGYKGKRALKGRFRGECSYCGLMKRYYLNKFAVDNHFTKVATGHNLTDEATTLLSNFFNTDLDLMARAGIITINNADGLIPRIKPLYYIYEQELILYSYFAKVEHLSTECEYASDSPMLYLKKSLGSIEQFRRGNMMNMVRDYQRNLKPILVKQIPDEKTVENKCIKCGSTTYLEKCSFCKTVERMAPQINRNKNERPSI